MRRPLASVPGGARVAAVSYGGERGLLGPAPGALECSVRRLMVFLEMFPADLLDPLASRFLAT